MHCHATPQVYDTVQEMAAEEENIRKHTTPAYRPPEMWDLYSRQLIDTKVDIWVRAKNLRVAPHTHACERAW